MKEMNREMELNMDELKQVNGGDSLCIVYGLCNNDGEANACFSEGGSAALCYLEGAETNSEDGYGFTACILAFGIGFGGTVD